MADYFTVKDVTNARVKVEPTAAGFPGPVTTYTQVKLVRVRKVFYIESFHCEIKEPGGLVCYTLQTNGEDPIRCKFTVESNQMEPNPITNELHLIINPIRTTPGS